MTTKLDEIKARWAPMAAGCVSRVERNEAEDHAEHDVAWLVGELEEVTKERDKYRADRLALIDASSNLLCGNTQERWSALAKVVDKVISKPKANQ